MVSTHGEADATLTPTQKSRKAWLSSGYTWMAGAAFTFSCMGALTKYTSQSLPSNEIVFFRGLIMSLFILVLAHRQGVSLRGQRWGLLLVRGALGSGALLCFFFAISQIRLADAMTLQLSHPIFVMGFAAVALRERPTGLEILLMVTALGGAILIVQPGSSLFHWASWIGLLSAVFSGMAYTLVRMLSRTEHRLSIIFAFAWMSCVFSIPLMWSSFVVPSLWLLLQVAGISFLAFFGQWLMTAAYEKERAGPVSSMSYLGVAFATFWGFVFWSELPNAWASVGMIVLVAACVTLSVARARSNTYSKKSP